MQEAIMIDWVDQSYRSIVSVHDLLVKSNARFGAEYTQTYRDSIVDQYNYHLDMSEMQTEHWWESESHNHELEVGR